MSGFRKQRIQELLQNFLTEEFRYLTDPRLTFVALSGVEVSSDYRSAKIFWTLPQSESSAPVDSAESSRDEQRGAVSKALRKSSGHLKRRIAEELDLRYVPELNFEYDDSFDRGNRIDELLKKAGY